LATAERTLPVRAAGLSAISGIAFVALLTLIHVVRRDVSLNSQTTSEYAIGDLGWLMVVAFLLSAVSYGALAVAVLARRPRRLARAGAILLALVAAGTVVGGIFVTDPVTTPQDQLSTSGTLHGLGAGLALMFLPVAALLVGFGLPSDSRHVLRWTAVLPLAALLMFLAVQAVPDMSIGWPERLLVLVYAVWQIVVARVLSRRTVR
jgi:hypothetical protein